jgi:hypothetical protein
VNQPLPNEDANAKKNIIKHEFTFTLVTQSPLQRNFLEFGCRYYFNNTESALQTVHKITVEFHTSINFEQVF